MPRVLPPAFFLGLDLGREQDHTALVVIERSSILLDGYDPTTFERVVQSRLVIRHIRRFPLRMSYAAVAAHVRDIVAQPPLLRQCAMALDNTGVGIAFYDFLRTPKPPAPIIPITITAGHSASRKHDAGWNVPKALLFSTLYTAFKDNRITIARKLRFARALLSELGSMRLSTSPSGHESFAPTKSSQHDDLVLATALAVYLALKIHKPITGHGPLPGIPAFNGF